MASEERGVLLAYELELELDDFSCPDHCSRRLVTPDQIIDEFDPIVEVM